MATLDRAEVMGRIAGVIDDWAALIAERDEARVKAARSDEYRAWWISAREATERAQDQAMRFSAMVDERARERDEAREQAKAAEAKVVDIGWRKNKLIGAIEAKGFVVRWGKDGTPEVLTKEQAYFRDATAQRLIDLGATISLLYGPGSPAWERLMGRDPGKPQDTLVKQEPVAAPEPEPTIYERARKRAVEWTRESLDAALKAELRAAFPFEDGPCDLPGCVGRDCRVWQARPWK